MTESRKPVRFYELTTRERVSRIVEEGVLDADDALLCRESASLPTAIASNLVENQIGAFPVPLGLAEHFIVDGRAVLVPMATEEPSVIAAAGNAAKRCSSAGGFATTVRRTGIQGQIVFIGHMQEPQRFLREHLKAIHEVAHAAHPSLEVHGGGLRDVRIASHGGGGGYTEFNLTVDVGQAMGANVVNTICEAVAHYLEGELPGLNLLMAILSNDAPSQSVESEARFPFGTLETGDFSGEEVARRITAAGRFAQISHRRAATQNKGIMNGVDAVVLATGNDTRNVAAAAYGALFENRLTWTTWNVEDGCLKGRVSMPMPLGVVGGAISTLPMAKLAMRIMGDPDAERLMGIIASVGLASNMAALRALVTKGIQSGHMNLQLKSLAVMAGARDDGEIRRVADLLRRDARHADLSVARAAVDRVRSGNGSRNEGNDDIENEGNGNADR